MRDLISYAADKTTLVEWLTNNASLYPKYIYIENNIARLKNIDRFPSESSADNSKSVSLLRVNENAMSFIQLMPVEILGNVASGDDVFAVLDQDAFDKIALVIDQTPDIHYGPGGVELPPTIRPLRFGSFA